MSISGRRTWIYALGPLFVLLFSILLLVRYHLIQPDPVVQKDVVTSNPTASQLAHAEPSLTEERTDSRPTKQAYDERRIREFFRKSFEDSKKALNEPGHGVAARFAQELQFRWRELRLAALAYPDLVRKDMLLLSQNSDADTLERFIAMYVLGVLSGNGDKEAEAGLVVLSNNGDERISVRALVELSSNDDAGIHRALYRAKAQAGVREAFKSLPYWPDSATEAVLTQTLEALPQGKQQPAYGIRLAAEDALEKHQLLKSAQGQNTILRVIEDYRTDHMKTSWAVRAAQVNALDGSLQAMRKRLDASEALAAGYIEREKARAVGSLELPDPNQELVSSTTAFHRDDKFLDDVLIAFASMGGKLTPLEQQRLRFFGYACDPKERLSELISGK